MKNNIGRMGVCAGVTLAILLALPRERVRAQYVSAVAPQASEGVANATTPQASIRKFELQHAKAADVLDILQQLKWDFDAIAVDERSNSLLISASGDKDSLRPFQEFLALIDVEAPAKIGGDDSQASKLPQPYRRDERAANIEALSQRYRALEQSARQIAEKHKTITSSTDDEKLRAELRRRVLESFKARQELQRAELRDFAQRLAAMQQSIDTRERIVEKIVERRMEVLLDPNSNWESGEPTETVLETARGESPSTQSVAEGLANPLAEPTRLRSDRNPTDEALRLTSGEAREVNASQQKESDQTQATNPLAPTPVAPKVPSPVYSGYSISWWLDTYWENTIAPEASQSNVSTVAWASKAIHSFRDQPDCDSAILQAMNNYYSAVQYELDMKRLVQAAGCIIHAAGSRHQKEAMDYLFKIANRMPEAAFEKYWESFEEEDNFLDTEFSNLTLNEQLATQLAEKLEHGTSRERLLVLKILFASERKPQDVETWCHEYHTILEPGFLAAADDAHEAVRLGTLQMLAFVAPTNPTVLSRVNAAIDSDSVAAVRSGALGLLCEIDPTNPSLTQRIASVLESEPSIDVRSNALDALLRIDLESELAHQTLMAWASSNEREKVQHALNTLYLYHENGKRERSVDELIELLSDPEWGMDTEVAQTNWGKNHRWARQYAIAVLGNHAAHAYRGLPTLEAELARNDPKTLEFTREAIDRIRGFCPDRPIAKLQGDWSLVASQQREGEIPFLDIVPDKDHDTVGITISGTKISQDARLLCHVSHIRQGDPLIALSDPEGKRRHCHGRFDFKADVLVLTLYESLAEGRETSKQTYEFQYRGVPNN